MTAARRTATLLTVIVPAARGTRVSATATGPAAGPYLLTVKIGATITRLKVTSDGVIG